MKSISIIIPAYNEEKSLADAVKTINVVVRSIFKDYELLILEDGSSDRTGIIADNLAKKNAKIRAIHFGRNRGFGYAYRQGVYRSSKKYVMMVPGDNEILKKSIKDILKHTGEADIIIPYIINKEVRSITRRVISICFTTLLNILFGFHLKYYNGLVLYESSLVKKVKMTTDSFAFQAEILIRLLKKGYSYKEVPMYIKKPAEGHKTKVFKIKNLIGVISSITRLFFEINFASRKGS
ncbi:glycosyltransferase family 2 protein [Candidatus Woesearchaeota archaeon]|nr:glycosyltransferase family 2 protein [Candidatus Woesearchaeota archaeon]